MQHKLILDLLPYDDPFLFVDELIEVNDSGVVGNYTFRSDLPFYRGHFKENPVTPGALLTECCAQIGVVCLGIYLMEGDFSKSSKIALTSSEMEFLLPVYPNEKVQVSAEKVYFRFNKLKCKVRMINEKGEVVCKGILAGILIADNEA